MFVLISFGLLVPIVLKCSRAIPNTQAPVLCQDPLSCIAPINISGFSVNEPRKHLTAGRKINNY